MAAGMGSRFGGLKQAAKFGPSRKTMLDFSMEDALRSGIEKAVFVIRSDIEKIFRAEVSGKYESLLDVHYVFQDRKGFPLPEGRSKPWGTGHAVLACADDISEPFIAINADDYYGASAYSDAAAFLRAGLPSTHALAGYRLRNTMSENGAVSRGVCSCDSELNLLGVREVGGLSPAGSAVLSSSGERFSGDEFASLNFWSFAPDFMPLLASDFDSFLSKNSRSETAEFYLPAAVDAAVRNGKIRVKILPTDEKWQGVTYKADVPVVEAFLKAAGRA